MSRGGWKPPLRKQFANRLGVDQPYRAAAGAGEHRSLQVDAHRVIDRRQHLRRLDRTIEVSVTNTTEKKRILKRIWPNLTTLRHLLKQAGIDLETGPFPVKDLSLEEALKAIEALKANS